MSHIEASSVIKYLINLKAHMPNYIFMQSKSLSSILIISASLSLAAAAAIIPIYHEASAKECNGSNCSDKQGSDSNSNDDHNNKHSNSDDNNGGGGNSAKKDKTPFVLSTPVPFP